MTAQDGSDPASPQCYEAGFALMTAALSVVSHALSARKRAEANCFVADCDAAGDAFPDHISGPKSATLREPRPIWATSPPLAQASGRPNRSPKIDFGWPTQKVSASRTTWPSRRDETHGRPRKTIRARSPHSFVFARRIIEMGECAVPTPDRADGEVTRPKNEIQASATLPLSVMVRTALQKGNDR